MDTTWIFNFGDGQADGGAHLKDRLGNKGANLAEMTNLGLPVPPGFTIPTDVCSAFYAADRQLPPELMPQIEQAMSLLETRTGKKFGDPANPLLISVRSGAAVSMPGMMDTVVNLGLNDEIVEGLASTTQNERFAYDSYRRFIESYSDVVLGIEEYHFEDIREDYKERHGIKSDQDLTGGDLKALIVSYKEMIEERTNKPFPQDPKEQMRNAIVGVLKSWMNPHAITKRRLDNISDDIGTAVTIEAMVFGNKGENSAAGTVFTRNQITGVNRPYGNYLMNSQGHNLVSGRDTGDYFTIRGKELHKSDRPSFEEAMPGPFNELLDIFQILEHHYRDMQDVEFTVEDGKLWILQTRDGKRSPEAARKIAVDMADEGLICCAEAVERAESTMSLDQLLQPVLDPKVKVSPIAIGHAASPGTAIGRLAFSSEAAEKLAQRGEDVIFCRMETSTKDIDGIKAAKGILTSSGDRTCHAAQVALEMKKPCVVGAKKLEINYADQTLTVAGTVIRAGEIITIHGDSGRVMLGAIPTIEPELSDSASRLIRWKQNESRAGKPENRSAVLAK